MCTLEKRGNLYILTLTGAGEHRLNPPLLNSLQSALRRLHSEPASPSSALITVAQGKFFCNGYDLAWAKSDFRSRAKLLSSKFRSVISDLISIPMPTIAAVTGHASAAGLILALTHDYVLMRKDKGFLYMSELDIGLIVSAWFVEILKCKIGDGNVRREIVLTAKKFTAEMAVGRGIVRSAYDSEEKTVDGAVKLGEELVDRKWDGHVYACNRMVLMRDVLEKLGFDETVEEGQNEESGIKSKL